ncbi:MAG: O-succinylbenzoic acid--CoA ligase [Flavobacteriaceae bacterium CG_4_8_14_3_um_filter_34_10]|nr:MAG: hypothetical protein AUK33_06430 [Flavobacteriaceae bacterium CG2_30_34_30]PIX09783.1 MAG: O-succinylbenzoic acid--CoA ligase [Flavobacteriaceae bacterium CG_4_8_14_3_um_filter_34_10]PIZ08495.1 MAG: O-succinylbenzoic acid--CoA ligase [Flavobacteriaceae bacterium CG_4_10_14_0_8_um_filter_34_31]
MTEPWLHIHPEFKLNEKAFALEDLILLAEALQLEGDKEEKEISEFLLEWLYPKNTLLMNTSGSTGSPKTIVLEKEKMIASAKATGAFFDLPAGTDALLCLSVNYIAGKMMLVRAMMHGWHLDIVSPNKQPLLQTIKSYDFAAMVPMQVQHSLKELHRVKKIIVGGAPVSAVLEKQLQEVPSKVFATYGMTETITHVAIRKLNNKTETEIKIKAYEALPGVTFEVDSRNCLVIHAPAISKKKINTNDVVVLLSKTQFQWLGRADFVINSGGHKVYPEQVEQVLALVIDVPYFISSIPDKSLGEKVILIIEGNKDAFPEIEYLGLHPYEKPKEIYFVKSFSYTTTGKINREETKKKIATLEGF